jgi:hypothetical protein
LKFKEKGISKKAVREVTRVIKDEFSRLREWDHKG